MSDFPRSISLGISIHHRDRPRGKDCEIRGVPSPQITGVIQGDTMSFTTLFHPGSRPYITKALPKKWQKCKSGTNNSTHLLGYADDASLVDAPWGHYRGAVCNGPTHSQARHSKMIKGGRGHDHFPQENNDTTFLSARQSPRYHIGRAKQKHQMCASSHVPTFTAVINCTRSVKCRCTLKNASGKMSTK